MYIYIYEYEYEYINRNMCVYISAYAFMCQYIDTYPNIRMLTWYLLRVSTIEQFQSPIKPWAV